MLEGKPHFINNKAKDKGGVIFKDGTIVLKDAIFVYNGAVAPQQEGWLKNR
jgi:predicted outer membrane repeat protein